MKRDPSIEAKRQYIRQYFSENIFPKESIDTIELHRFSKGEYLCHAGERVEYFHIIVEGRCHVMPSSESGKEFLMDQLEPLGFNGDIELFNECEALHSVKASTPVAALAISRKVFFGKMMQSPFFLQMLCKSFATKIYQSSIRHSNNMLYSIQHRLSRMLLNAVEEQGSDCIRVKMSETAQSLGISARHLRRVLSNYESEGILQRQSSWIEILDIDTLRKHVNI